MTKCKCISSTPSISADSVDLLLDSFNSKVKNVIDDIAPMKVCKKNGRQKSPWKKSKAVQSMKRQCRKAERMWRKTKLEIHYSIYKDSLHAFNVELATARQTFFSNLINNNLNNTQHKDLLEVVNSSLLSGTFPNSLKTAVVKLLLKKRNLDNTILSNYRPISNLPFIGKIIEKVVFDQLNNYLNSNGYLDNFQLGFRVHRNELQAKEVKNVSFGRI